MKKTLIKIVKLIFLFIIISGCEADDNSYNVDADNGSGGGSSNINPYGNWKRGDGLDAYLKFSNSAVSMCNNGTITMGTFNVSEPSMTYVVQGNVIKFPLRFNADNSLLVGVPDQAINTNNATLYYRSDQFPCDGGGSGGSTTGKVMFWVSSDLGCGPISVSLNGSSGTITSYYSNNSPDCGGNGCANFTLPPGNYSYSASCSNGTWNGSVLITSGGCYKIKLIN